MEHLDQQYDGFLSGPVATAHLVTARSAANATFGITNATTVIREVVLFMHLEKTAGTLVRRWMTEKGWAQTGYCDESYEVQRELIRLLQSDKLRIFVEHHCGIDW